MIDWQSITRSLPRDGETVLIFVPGRGEDFDDFCLAQWRARGSEWVDEMKCLRRPSHWARLDPPAPA